MLGFTTILNYIQQYTIIYNNIQLYTTIYNYIQQYLLSSATVSTVVVNGSGIPVSRFPDTIEMKP